MTEGEIVEELEQAIIAGDLERIARAQGLQRAYPFLGLADRVREADSVVADWRLRVECVARAESASDRARDRLCRELSAPGTAVMIRGAAPGQNVETARGLKERVALLPGLVRSAVSSAARGRLEDSAAYLRQADGIREEAQRFWESLLQSNPALSQVEGGERA